MRTVTRTLLTLAVAVLMAAPVIAAEKHKGKKPKGGRQHKTQFQAISNLLKGIELTEDQKTQVAELQKEFAPKLADLRAKTNAILTEEQKTARREAFKAAKAAGRKKVDLAKTLNLTDEQKKKMQEVTKARRDLMLEIKAKILPLLTDEQKAKLPSRAKGHHRKRAAGAGKGKHKKAEQ